MGPAVWGQIFLFIGALESLAHKGKLSPEDLFADGRQPGNFGAFVPKFAKSEKELADLELKVGGVDAGRGACVSTFAFRFPHPLAFSPPSSRCP